MMHHQVSLPSRWQTRNQEPKTSRLSVAYSPDAYSPGRPGATIGSDMHGHARMTLTASQGSDTQ